MLDLLHAFSTSLISCSPHTSATARQLIVEPDYGNLAGAANWGSSSPHDRPHFHNKDSSVSTVEKQDKKI